MASSQDTEITLGTGKLLFLFFGLVGVCALFFAVGYSLGRKSEPNLASAGTVAAPQPAPTTSKTTGNASQPMTFYKNVEQKDATPQLTPAADSKTDTMAAAPTTQSPAQAPAGSGDSTVQLPTLGYFVQVAAVSKQEDADALVDALKKKQYAALVAAPVPTDKLFRVQVGPFSDIKDAEATRTKLIADGYSPIVKK